MDYICKNHRKYFLKVHIIFVTKYRKPLLVGRMNLEIKRLLKKAESRDFEIELI